MRRRVRAAQLLLVAAAALAGSHALHKVPLDAIPDLGDTQVIVYSRWDRSPDLVEAQVTYPIVTAMLDSALDEIDEVMRRSRT